MQPPKSTFLQKWLIGHCRNADMRVGEIRQYCGVGEEGGALDTVVRAFTRGATVEEITQQYPSLSLSDVYATISYYLQNREEVEKYLEKRRKHAQAVKRENQKRFDQTGIRERLLARRIR